MPLMSPVVEKLIRPTVLAVLLAWERWESGVDCELLSEDARTDPYEVYRRLRSADPVHRMRTIDAWALTRYRDVEGVLRDHERFSNVDRFFQETIPLSLLELDPPEHTRLRSLISKAFTPKAVTMLHGRIQKIADERLDTVAGASRFDLVAALGYPLPVTVIAEMLGVRPSDLDLFKGWSDAVALSVNALLTADQIRAAKLAASEIHAYFETIIEERRRQPREDLVSALFDDPDTLDIGRGEKSHLSFGRGIHYCLGASLAVLEARIAFATLLHRFPSITLAAEPRYRDGVALRGVEQLWIEVERT